MPSGSAIGERTRPAIARQTYPSIGVVTRLIASILSLMLCRYTSQKVAAALRERPSRSEQPDERPPDQSAKVPHWTTASPDSQPLASRTRFPIGTVRTLCSILYRLRPVYARRLLLIRAATVRRPGTLRNRPPGATLQSRGSPIPRRVMLAVNPMSAVYPVHLQREIDRRWFHRSGTAPVRAARLKALTDFFGVASVTPRLPTGASRLEVLQDSPRNIGTCSASAPRMERAWHA